VASALAIAPLWPWRVWRSRLVMALKTPSRVTCTQRPRASVANRTCLRASPTGEPCMRTAPRKRGDWRKGCHPKGTQGDVELLEEGVGRGGQTNAFRTKQPSNTLTHNCCPLAQLRSSWQRNKRFDFLCEREGSLWDPSGVTLPQQHPPEPHKHGPVNFSNSFARFSKIMTKSCNVFNTENTCRQKLAILDPQVSERYVRTQPWPR
jgi:hypothetical protein